MLRYWRLPPSKYNQLLARCAPGTHEAVANMIVRREVPRRSVLDLAAGTGALLARLADLGFTDLNAVELDLSAFQLPGVTPVPTDLNGDFARAFNRRFDLITAIEIVEHLDSPRHFLKQIWTLLEPDGHLILSTPNIGHWVGRIWFATRGELRYFKESDYHHQRHISPINHTHMRLMLREIGFRLEEFSTAGSFYGPLKRVLTAPAAGLFRILQGPATAGDVCIYFCQKADPDHSSLGRSSDTYIHRGQAAAEPQAIPADKT